MANALRLVALSIITFSVTPTFSQTKSIQRAITNQDVLEMVQAKLSAETIIKAIQQAPVAHFAITPQAPYRS